MKINIEFDILKDHNRGYVVIRKNGTYEQHGHIKTLNGARMLISFIQKGQLPRSEYLRGSCRRLLTEDEFALLKEKKQQYYNVNKGGKRR